jgi:hypothetical protein
VHLPEFQSVTAQGLRIPSSIDREHLLQHAGRHPVRHQGAEMRLKLIQLWCRPAMRWPSNAGLDPATPSTAKSRKPHPDPTEQRRDRMLPIVLHAANAATASAVRPSHGVASGLRGDDLLLQACQQQLPVGQGQPQIGDIAEIIGPVDPHDVGALPLTISPSCH